MTLRPGIINRRHREVSHPAILAITFLSKLSHLDLVFFLPSRFPGEKRRGVVLQRYYGMK